VRVCACVSFPHRRPSPIPVWHTNRLGPTHSSAIAPFAGLLILGLCLFWSVLLIFHTSYLLEPQFNRASCGYCGHISPPSPPSRASSSSVCASWWLFQFVLLISSYPATPIYCDVRIDSCFVVFFFAVASQTRPLGHVSTPVLRNETQLSIYPLMLTRVSPLDSLLHRCAVYFSLSRACFKTTNFSHRHLIRLMLYLKSTNSIFC